MQQADSAPNPPQEVTHIPLWVKGLVAVSVILFAVDTPNFMSSLSDAIQKNRAEKAYQSGQYAQAIDRYKDLRSRYPTDDNFIKQLGFSYYRAGRYSEALDTFNLLAGIKMPKREAEEINAAISDIATKLNLNKR